MITITRHTARRLRTVFRRSALGISHRGPVPPLILHAEGQQRRAQHHYLGLAVEHVEPGTIRQLDSVPVPLEVLAEVEGRDDTPVEIESLKPDRIRVRRRDRGIPRAREHTVVPIGRIAPFPETPSTWSEAPAELLTALAEASSICTHESTRYALDCVQLRGTDRQIIVTDGRQLLLRSGFELPWDGDVLIRGNPIFRRLSQAQDRPLQIGKTDTHVVLRVGPWTTWHAIQDGVRFPRVEGVITDAAAGSTRLHLDSDDAAFLQTALDRIPGKDDEYAPVTLNCNGVVSLLARGSGAEPRTELVLARSRYTGEPIHLSTDRSFVRRALELGFRALSFTGVEQPVVARGPNCLYVWQPLHPDSAIEAQADTVRIGADEAADPSNRITTIPTTPRIAMNENPHRNAHVPATPSHGNSPATDGPGLAALIRDAETLHATLGDARTNLARLIAGLRRHRKQSRLLSDTLRSLRQLRLTEVAE
jgi:hypothetical protein